MVSSQAKDRQSLLEELLEEESSEVELTSTRMSQAMTKLFSATVMHQKWKTRESALETLDCLKFQKKKKKSKNKKSKMQMNISGL